MIKGDVLKYILITSLKILISQNLNVTLYLQYFVSSGMYYCESNRTLGNQKILIARLKIP